MRTATLDRKLPLVVLAVAAGAVFLALVLARGGAPERALASSHSEAPLISEDPRADNTDLYAFVSPDRPNTVAIIANYIPLEAPAGGPNFASFDDSVLYAINVDTNGDSIEDVSYQFRFHTDTKNPNTFLYNDGPITSLDDANRNRPQTYTLTLVRRGPGNSERSEVLGQNLPTPPVNIGPRSTPDYDALANAAVATVGNGIKTFAGQRDDPFFVDLGSIFDLAGLRPFNAFHILPLAVEAGRDAVARYNTHTIALQVPIDQLVSGPSPTIGIYANASRQQISVLRKDGTTDEHGPWAQVSRLGEPLINEAVIPLGKKDLWNRSEPEDDQQFERFYLTPEVSALEDALYPALNPIRLTNRGDLVQILLTGIPGVNFTGSREADLLRLNTAIKPNANGACYHPLTGKPASTAPSRLGAIDGDVCGFPNGRRLADDVVDIELRAFADGYGTFLNAAFGLPNQPINNTLGDGVDANDKPFLSSFPYVASPHQGYQVP